MYYQLTASTNITRTSDGASIPADPANSDYVKYLAWVSKGNVATPYVPPAPTVPQVVSPAQFRCALTRMGLRVAVDNAVTTSDQDTKDWYAFATVFERQNPRVLAMAILLSVNAVQLDALWTLGATLP